MRYLISPLIFMYIFGFSISSAWSLPDCPFSFNLFNKAELDRIFPLWKNCLATYLLIENSELEVPIPYDSNTLNFGVLEEDFGIKNTFEREIEFGENGMHGFTKIYSVFGSFIAESKFINGKEVLQRKNLRLVKNGIIFGKFNENNLPYGDVIYYLKNGWVEEAIIEPELDSITNVKKYKPGEYEIPEKIKGILDYKLTFLKCLELIDGNIEILFIDKRKVWRMHLRNALPISFYATMVGYYSKDIDNYYFTEIIGRNLKTFKALKLASYVLNRESLLLERTWEADLVKGSKNNYQCEILTGKEEVLKYFQPQIDEKETQGIKNKI